MVVYKDVQQRQNSAGFLNLLITDLVSLLFITMTRNKYNLNIRTQQFEHTLVG